MTEALAGPPRHGRAATARPLRIASESTVLACVCQPKPQAVALLSQVVARLHGLDVPVVQFIQVSADAKPAGVARDFAEASLTRLGRTLLASLHEADITQPGVTADRISETAVGRRGTRKPPADGPDIVPDATVQGLYHARIGGGLSKNNQISQVPPTVWLGEARLDFKLLVIDCGPLERNPAAVELASRCHGSVLSVAAGATRLSEVRAVARQVQIAGGTLLGSVLYDTPPLPYAHLADWLKRLAGLRSRTQ